MSTATQIKLPYVTFDIFKNATPSQLLKIKSDIGGKAYNSFAMKKAGQNVPAMIGLGKNFFDDLTSTLSKEIEAAFSMPSDGNYYGWMMTPEILGFKCQQIQNLVQSKDFSSEMTSHLLDVYNLLGGDNAVFFLRSSSNSEDGNQSFAGRQLTVPYVRGFANFVQAIKNVIASLFSYQAVAYRLEHGLNVLDDYMPVHVQIAINPTHCAVGFYYNGEDPTLEIDFAAGTGSTIADGECNASKAEVDYNLYKLTLQNSTQWIVQDGGRVEVLQVLIENLWKNAVTLTLPIQKISLVYNPEAFSAIDNTIKIPVIQRPDAELYKNLLPKAIDLVIELTEFFGAQQDIELSILVENYTYCQPVNLDQVSFYRMQSRLNTAEVGQGNYTPKPDIDSKPVYNGISIKRRVVPGKVNFVHSVQESKDSALLGPDFIHVVPDGGFDYDHCYIKYGRVIFMNSATNAHGPTVARELFYGGGTIIAPNDDIGIDEFFKTLEIKEGDEIVVDDKGSIYRGMNPLVDWQTEEDKLLIQEILTNLKPIKFEIGFNSGSVHAAKEMREILGFDFTIPLLRAERLLQDGGSFDIQYIAMDASQEFQQQYVEEKAQNLFEIVMCSKSTTYRFFGPCGDERTGDFAPPQVKKNPTKLGMYQGVRQSLEFPESLALECSIVKRARQLLDSAGAGKRLKIMAQFTRSARELKQWLDFLSSQGIDRTNYVIGTMFENPSLFFELEAIAKLVDFISIGTNDLWMLFYGVDRPGSDPRVIAAEYPVNSQAFTSFLKQIIEKAVELGLIVSICGEILSAHPDLAKYFAMWGVSSAPVASPIDLLKINKEIYDLNQD